MNKTDVYVANLLEADAGLSDATGVSMVMWRIFSIPKANVLKRQHITMPTSNVVNSFAFWSLCRS